MALVLANGKRVPVKARAATTNPGTGLPSPQDQRNIIQAAAQKYGIDPAVLWGLYGTETDYGHNLSTSSAGAVGPFQFLPSTAKGMGVNPYDFRSSAFGAARYLSQYKGRGVGGMLSAYNAGPAGGYQGGYVDSVLAKAKTWAGGNAAAAGAAPSSSPAATGATPTDLPAGLDAIGQFFAALLNPNTWLRIILFIIGLVLMGLAAYQLTRK